QDRRPGHQPTGAVRRAAELLSSSHRAGSGRPGGVPLSYMLHSAVTPASHARPTVNCVEGALKTAKRVLWGLVVGVLVASSAGAQILGLFYAEERKGDRIYVFNNKANWERFTASGETGTGLTRIGVGPKGETVFADNE